MLINCLEHLFCSLINQLMTTCDRRQGPDTDREEMSVYDVQDIESEVRFDFLLQNALM